MPRKRSSLATLITLCAAYRKRKLANCSNALSPSPPPAPPRSLAPRSPARRSRSASEWPSLIAAQPLPRLLIVSLALYCSPLLPPGKCNSSPLLTPPTHAQLYSFVGNKYGVKFTMMEKVDVNGPNTHPVVRRGPRGCAAGSWGKASFLVSAAALHLGSRSLLFHAPSRFHCAAGTAAHALTAHARVTRTALQWSA